MEVSLMCVTIIDTDGEWLDCDASILVKYGWTFTPDEIDEIHRSVPREDSMCFCTVDVEAMLDRYGIPYVSEAGGGFLVLQERQE